MLLQASSSSTLGQMTNSAVTRWLNVEMPTVQSSRVDLLGATAEDSLVHVELQATNEKDMALRMAEYALRIYRQFRKFPKQTVLYVGERPMRMTASWAEPDPTQPNFTFQYALMDIRELDATLLLESPRIEDNLLAILTGFEDPAGMVRQILQRIVKLEAPERRRALEQFLIISGLRRLGPIIEEEAQKMPILNDIMDHEVIGPAIRKGLEQGRLEGRQEGRLEGRQEGRQEAFQEASQKTVRRFLEKRFGVIPPWAEARLAKLSVSELDDLALRIFDTSHLEELFQADH
jgi:hypothetical protein